MNEFKITEDVINSVLQYLATKPYAEVAQLIAALQQVEPLAEQPTPEED